MGSKIEPYFILTAEKVTDPKELKGLIKQNDCVIQEHVPNTPCVIQEHVPNTPPPSGVSGNTGLESTDLYARSRYPNKRKGFVKYKIPIKEFRKKENLNKKMELIKEKLEKSRERFKEQKLSNEELNLTCGLMYSHIDNGTSASAYKLERSVSDMSPVKSGEGNSPYTLFVVSDENCTEEASGKVISKSADKRRRVRTVEENRLKRDRKEGQKTSVKRNGLARELGLKSTIISKSETNSSKIPSVSHIVFEGPENQPPPKSRHTSSSKVLRTSYSPPRIPPSTPATVLTLYSGENKTEQQIIDVDENIPRKPFLSGPLYSGKNRGTHAFSLQHFEIPNATPDQKRRALGLGTKFEEFAYPKPQSEQRQRKVSFANPLPVIKGTGLIVDEIKENIGFQIPQLGPRAVTLGSITLPSERLDKQSMCQKYLAGDSMSSSKRLKKSGVPLSLPKIDIVSNVYDDMIIKMIKEYLQDTNTPSRQSQLAKELLVYLQKHNENMKELNVPITSKKQKAKLSQQAFIKNHSRARQILQDMSFIVPPNTAEDMEPKVMSPTMKATDELLVSGLLEGLELDESGNKRQVKSADNPRSVPFVQITYKQKDKETEAEMTSSVLKKDDATLNDDCSNPKTQLNEKKSNERPILSVVTPVSFQMAPPGLSKEDSFVSVPLKSQYCAKI